MATGEVPGGVRNAQKMHRGEHRVYCLAREVHRDAQPGDECRRIEGDTAARQTVEQSLGLQVDGGEGQIAGFRDAGRGQPLARFTCWLAG